MNAIYILIVLSLVYTEQVSSTDKDRYEETAAVANTALAKLVKIFSKPGAFKQMNNLLGDDSIQETSTSCPEGEDGLECRRSEARKSVDCPHGDISEPDCIQLCSLYRYVTSCIRVALAANFKQDQLQRDCYCGNCAVAGPQMWASCCRQGLRCCSHLAAACRTCDHEVLRPFCSKHFKKCINHSNEKKQN